MNVKVPADFENFVQSLLDSRRYLSEEEVISEGLHLLKSREVLRAEVQNGFEQLDAGLGVQGDVAINGIRRRLSTKRSGEHHE